jgi:hypothetical protein
MITKEMIDGAEYLKREFCKIEKDNGFKNIMIDIINNMIAEWSKEADKKARYYDGD